MRLAAVSVDLDEIPCYSAIHGVAQLEGEAAHAVYRKAVPRLEALFTELGVHATFFAIGRDLDDSIAAETIRRLARAGHEIGNHSYSHAYDLTRLPAARIYEEIARGAQAIARVTGTSPVGFRAPGYTVNDAVFDALMDQGAVYDSSVFPCPPYYAAKAAAIATYKLRKRPTHSVIDDPRVLTAPAEPYRVGRPYYDRGNGLLEFPIGVTHEWTGRLPYIGTNLVLAGVFGARQLTRLIAGRNLVNLELHGIDAADAEDDGLQELAVHQPDLRKRGSDKLAALRATIGALHDHGYEFVTLADAARVFGSISDS
jgi:peptidoglycan/xylan/chitin deacetylase (PgdA/CDA1 family)